MPLITFVDKDDKIIGSGKKEEVWRKGIIHRIVRMLLFNSQGELLIQKRADHVSSLPGRWDQSAAGHVDEGESYDQAASRELMEEIGVSEVSLKRISKYFSDDTDENEKDKIKKRFNALYVAVYDGEIKPDPGEVSEVKWIKPEDLERRMQDKPSDFTKGFINSFKIHREYQGKGGYL